MPVEVQARRWTMRVIALLLAGQALIRVVIIWLNLRNFNWDQGLSLVMRSFTVRNALLLGGLLSPMAIFDLVTAMALWKGRRSAWLRAMISQGILLIFCLSSYVVGEGERYIYPLMLSCILLVLYLKTYDVRLSFTSRERKNRTTPR